MIVSARFFAPVPSALAAERPTFELPVWLGVPLIKPVLVFSERPAGRLVAPYSVGELVATI